MTCAHVLGLIDAGPFADYPRAHLAVAWQHARQCATCGPALEAATALTADLTALARPAPPPELTATVLARIAQIESANPTFAATARLGAQAPSGTRDWWAWATAFGGIGAALAIVWSAPLGGLAQIDIALPRVRGIATGLVVMPSTAAGALVLAAGLGLYVAGLFGPFGQRRRL
jgi:hypothetical protein